MSYLIKTRPSKRHGTAFDLYYRWRGQKYRPLLGYNLSAEEAERRAIKMVAQIQHESDALLPQTTSLTLSDAVATYWKTMQNTHRVDLVRPRIALEKHLMPRFGRRTLASLTADDGIEYVSARREDKAAPATIRREWNVFMRILNLAVDHDKLDKNRLKRVALPEAVGRERIANDADLFAIQKMACEELWSIVLVALHTGLREGKILEIKGAWLTLRDDGWWLSVPASRSRLKGTPRELPLNRIAAQVLRERCVNDKVFTRWSRASLAVHWGRLCKRAQVQDLHFHDLRHTFTTVLQNSGVGLEVRSALLGHTVRGIGGDFGSTAMTSRYSHGGHGWNAELRRAVTLLETAYNHAVLSYDLSYGRCGESAATSQPAAKPLQDQENDWCPQREGIVQPTPQTLNLAKPYLKPTYGTVRFEIESIDAASFYDIVQPEIKGTHHVKWSVLRMHRTPLDCVCGFSYRRKSYAKTLLASFSDQSPYHRLPQRGEEHGRDPSRLPTGTLYCLR